MLAGKLEPDSKGMVSIHLAPLPLWKREGSYNGGQKNSGVCEKPFQVIVTEDPAPNDNFFIGSKFIPSSPTSPLPPPPSNVLAPKKFSSKFNFVLGGRGGVTRFTNITGKVPTLLTSIVEPKCVPQVFLGLLLRTGASNSRRK